MTGTTAEKQVNAKTPFKVGSWRRGLDKEGVFVEYTVKLALVDSNDAGDLVERATEIRKRLGIDQFIASKILAVKECRLDEEDLVFRLIGHSFPNRDALTEKVEDATMKIAKEIDSLLEKRISEGRIALRHDSENAQ